jgi:oligoribonuclease NrnB/cAMP/cGMP phosphodiesterase (DHH superfamily)
MVATSNLRDEYVEKLDKYTKKVKAKQVFEEVADYFLKQVLKHFYIKFYIKMF